MSPVRPFQPFSQQVTAASRFYLNLKPRSTPQLTVISGGREECAPDYVIDRTTFPFWAIEFVVAGTGELQLVGKSYALVPGSVFAYGPRIAHTIRRSTGSPLVKYFVGFTGTPSLSLLRACDLRPGEAIQVSAVGDVRSAFDALIRFGLHYDRRTERTCALQLELLLHTIARSRETTVGSNPRARVTFERVRQYIDNHFVAVSSIQEIASACHVDNSHLSRLFRRFLAEPPLRYLQRRRMQWAADRLQGSGRLVREVADELLMDPFQFSRTFKRVHGISPTAFLHRHG